MFSMFSQMDILAKIMTNYLVGHTVCAKMFPFLLYQYLIQPFDF